MTVNEFNTKYKEYLDEGHYGLDIHIPKVIDFLDEIFFDLIQLPGFKYQQIKLKFDDCRFYFKTNFKYKFLEISIAQGIEDKVNRLLNNENK